MSRLRAMRFGALTRLHFPYRERRLPAGKRRGRPGHDRNRKRRRPEARTSCRPEACAPIAWAKATISSEGATPVRQPRSVHEFTNPDQGPLGP